MVRKVSALPSRILKGKDGIPGKPGAPGAPGKDGVTVIKTIEVPVNQDQILIEIEALTKKLDKLEKKKPEVVQYGGGGHATTNYLFTNQATSHWRKPSFVNGLNVIGVRFAGAASVYLPHDLDPTMIVSVKDETGSGNVTVYIE